MTNMKRLAIFVVLLSLLIGLVTGCQPEFQPGTFTDDMGREVSINEIPQRIVSHVPSVTETLFAIGLDEKVVGVSDYCDYPEEAKLKPSVGSFWSPSIENIVALEPDLVLTSGDDEQFMLQLDSLEITYVVIDPKDIDGILQSIELMGSITGTKNRAEELIEDMTKSINRIVNQTQNAPKVRVFYTFATTDLNNPWTAGPGSFIDSLITLAGGENIAARVQAPFMQFSIEEVFSSDPEIIITNDSMGSAVVQVEALRQHPVWSQMTALKQNRVYVIDGDLVNRSGPRIVQGLEEVTKIIHPELFE